LWSNDLDNRLRVAEAVVREASRIAANHFAPRELFSIDRKGAQDLVREADRACEDLTVAGYRACFRKMASSAKSAARAILRRPRSG
jgi:fructose-1,6-bisphosphatase/inositol monophosphatase family enzyme